jgi:hypothetical protein
VKIIITSQFYHYQSLDVFGSNFIGIADSHASFNPFGNEVNFWQQEYFDNFRPKLGQT